MAHFHSVVIDWIHSHAFAVYSCSTTLEILIHFFKLQKLQLDNCTTQRDNSVICLHLSAKELFRYVYPSLFWHLSGVVAVIAGKARQCRYPSAQKCFPAPLGGPRSITKPDEIQNLSSVSSVPWVFYKLDMPEKQVSWSDVLTISTSSDRCEGSADVLQAPSGWLSSLPCRWRWALPTYRGNSLLHLPAHCFGFSAATYCFGSLSLLFPAESKESL